MSLLSKIHSLFMSHSNGSVMHTSIRACFLYFFYNPYMSLFNSKNFFIYLSPLFFYLRPANFMLIISYMYIHNIIHDSLQTIATLYLQMYLFKYTSKEGLELFRLLTMELCFVTKMCSQDLGVPCATCTTYYITHEALYVVALMCLMYGWPWKYQYRHSGSLVKG